jgi:hypothetical protein
MMTNYTPKTYRNAILKQCVRYLFTESTNVEDRVFMGVRGTADEDLLYRRFLAVKRVELIEETLGRAPEFKSTVGLAIRYRIFLGAYRCRLRQFH